MTEFPPIDRARTARILAWAENDPALQRRFRAQLAERTGWNPERCERAIGEYLRFCAIAARLGGRAVPSAAVDEVWHLHLTWTRDYWEDFCPRRLGFALHHQPSRGLPGEREALREAYAETLHAYAAEFGQPALDWWPAWSTQRSPTHRGRWIRLAAALGLLPAAALAYPGPLDWRGPEFLSLYLVLLAASLMSGVGLRLWHRWRRDPTRGFSPGEPPLWQLAYLRGGPRGLVDAAAAQLHEEGFLDWDASSKTLVRRRQDAPDDALLRSLLPNLCGKPSQWARAEQAGPVQQVRETLVRQGGWHAPQAARRIAFHSALPLWLLAGFGSTKIAIGLLRDRPVALLVFLVIATVVAALLFHFKRPGITRAGRDLLRAQRARHALTLRAPRKGELALAVALVGTGVLSGTALAGYHELRYPPSSGDSGGSSSSDSGSDSGGSGCGGCGGD
ncbi:TIGR04222 domain-containing membrane protein [Aquimonas voraii]|uniref:TIGR04222 domain-containing protein n=1 Tax=Aquimonas voraii TaxID=265719 RepID=A0A1G6WWB1_9GAMM|nr:TIGR04222 domain-containing membrane protein [Aquimonas voraii]SDD70131.1 TIGR04222 domain-containing protein [Aquimonas voraii]